MLFLPYERDDHSNMYPIEYRIGLVALEDAHYVKTDLEQNTFSTTDFRSVDLDGDHYMECEEIPPAPSAADSEAPPEPRNECKSYPVASQDIRCAKDAAARMMHVPKGIQADALLLSIIAVESMARGRANRNVEFMLWDAAGVVGWQPDFSLGRGQIRVSTAARLLSDASGVDVNYATARDYLEDDCKTLFLMARYLDELFAEESREARRDEAFKDAVRRYNGQQGRSIQGTTYTSVVTGAYKVFTGDRYADNPEADRSGDGVLDAERISFQPAETALDLEEITSLQSVINRYKLRRGTVVLIQARSDGVGPPNYQQSLIDMRTKEIKLWLLRLGAIDTDIHIVPIALDRLSETGDSRAAVVASGQ